MRGKMFIFLIVCLSFGFFILSRAQEKNYTYQLTPIIGSLTCDEVQAALDYLGLHIERFTYEVPYKHHAHFTLQQYFRGKRKYAPGCEGSFSLDAGQHTVTLFIHERDDTIDFAVQSEGVRYSLGSVSANGLHARTWSRLANVELIDEEKVPFFVLAANRESISGFRPYEPMEIIVSNYELVIVVLFELKRD